MFHLRIMRNHYYYYYINNRPQYYLNNHYQQQVRACTLETDLGPNPSSANSQLMILNTLLTHCCLSLSFYEN